MNNSTRVTLCIIAGSALAGCHHRQADPVYPAPVETTTTTTTTTTAVAAPETGMPSSGTTSSSSSTTSMTTRREGGSGMSGMRAERREIHLAMASIERARRELERSGHDFGGRKAEALKATGAALHELRIVSGQEAREARAGEESAAERRVEGRELHMALVDLERARADMEHAKHDFSGRRKETIEAVDSAIREIRLAAEHER